MQATIENVFVERRSAVRRTRRIDDCFSEPGACAGFMVAALAGFAFGFVVAWVFF